MYVRVYSAYSVGLNFKQYLSTYLFLIYFRKFVYQEAMQIPCVDIIWHIGSIGTDMETPKFQSQREVINTIDTFG